jgi:hypothetical protein
MIEAFFIGLLALIGLAFAVGAGVFVVWLVLGAIVAVYERITRSAAR